MNWRGACLNCLYSARVAPSITHQPNLAPNADALRRLARRSAAPYTPHTRQSDDFDTHYPLHENLKEATWQQEEVFW